MRSKIQAAQASLQKQGLGGWLLYDFRKSNDLAHEFLEIPPETLCTRRFFYWIPAQGEPVRITHAIEKGHLDHLPGVTHSYLSWQDLEERLASVLQGQKRVAMEYSPRNALPYVSKVDAGTMEVVRDSVEEVLSSADLLQEHCCLWDEEKLQQHLEAMAVLEEAVALAWDLIGDSLRQGRPISDVEVQERILETFDKAGCETESPPICAVNASSADPHFAPSASNPCPIQVGDWVLIDLWCKKKHPKGTYADITRVGVAAAQPTARQEEIFGIVKQARDAALDLVQSRFSQKKVLKGWEVDALCRKQIEEAGYGPRFIHRTGHSIDGKDHGNGANLDNLETRDDRQILPRTCFSIEPGIYLPGEFGVRLEYDVFVDSQGQARVTGHTQEAIHCVFKEEDSPR